LLPHYRLTALRCHLCKAQLVLVAAASVCDRLICPICLAAGDHAEVVADATRLKRGTPIDSRLRFLVDRARFPRPAGSEGVGGSR
jgi:hypothetical protein